MNGQTSDRRFSPRRLKDARGDRSIEQLAVAVGVSGRTIQNWEAGESVPNTNQLAIIAGFLRRPLGWFFESAA